MRNTITLKEFSALSYDAVQITHGSAPGDADSQPQRTPENVRRFNVPPTSKSFRAVLDRRYTTPYHFITPTPRWGLNE